VESPSPDWDSADPVRRIRNREEDERSRTSGVSSGIAKAIKRICRQIVGDPQPLTMSAILVFVEQSYLENSYDSCSLSVKAADGISSNFLKIGKVSLINQKSRV
jgi:hypothetical protein